MRLPATRRLLGLIAALAVAAPLAATPTVTATAADLSGDVADTGLSGDSITDPVTDTDAGQLLAGAAKVDATWHVGASAGQYAGEGPGSVVDQPDDGGVDPHVHSTTSRSTYGVESRAWVRALAVEEQGGQRWALITNDLYIPQELVNQRIAAKLEEHDRKVELGLIDGTTTGISDENLTITTSHSHASPYYSSTAWGVFAFQDVFDIRFYEFIADKMADAVIEATNNKVAARVGAANTELTVTKGNPEGPTVGANNTPAAYPASETDPTFTVVRFDDVSDPTDPKLLANWAVFGRHPEGLDGNDIHSGEYVNKAFRVVEREIGGVTLFSLSDVGTGEVTEDAEAHPPRARQEWDSNSYNRRERLARRMASTIEATTADVAAASDDDPATTTQVATDVVPARTNVALGVKDMRFAPPSGRGSSNVSNCRTRSVFEANPGVPIVGLPTCQQPEDYVGEIPFPSGVTYEMLRRAGIPVPDNYGGPSYTGLQETLQVHLQAVRLGSIGITVCPCEAWTALSRNIRSRLDTKSGNFYFGFDWTANYHMAGWQPGVIYDGQDDPDPDDAFDHGPLQLDIDAGKPGKQTWCIPQDGDGNEVAPDQATQWQCRKPSLYPEPPNDDGEDAYLDPVPDEEFRRWKARIYNDATGWDDLANSAEAESEPADPAEIWGNWIHEEQTDHGFQLIVPVSMGNSYQGYQPTYREFQVRDYYRKSLAGLGPHSADFIVTRLTRMAAELNGAPDDLVQLNAKDQAYAADEEFERARADSIGKIAEIYLPAYEAQLPADGGAPAVTAQPADIQRFDAAEVTWVGGSNYTDVPHARVQRCVEDDPTACDPDEPGDWTAFGDGYGEVQTIVDFPDEGELAAYRAGTYQWHWTATFEAFDSEVGLPDASGHTHGDSQGRGSQVPTGVYRFVIDGCFRHATPTGTTPDDPDGKCGSYDTTGRVAPYELTSEPFRVGNWQGITVEEFSVSQDGETATIDVGPNYPYPLSASNADATTFRLDTGSLTQTPRTYRLGIFDYPAVDAVDYPDGYESPFPYLHHRHDDQCQSEDGCDNYKRFGAGSADDEAFCFECTFEPWADTGAIETVTVTVESANGTRTERVQATYDPETGTWTAPVELKPNNTAYVAAGAIVDTFGETNGQASPRITREPPGK